MTDVVSLMIVEDKAYAVLEALRVAHGNLMDGQHYDAAAVVALQRDGARIAWLAAREAVEKAFVKDSSPT